MASTEYSQQMRQGVEAGHADYGTEAQGTSQSGELRGLLNAIVDQISEADRRHTETLQQMQDRLTGIGRETKAIKPRVPGQYAAAFERIEAGMAELANRITEASGEAPAAAYAAPSASAVQVASQVPFAAHSTGTLGAPHASFAEPPKALRSASDTPGHTVSRVHAGVDTFDVIESSSSASMADPWDHESAEALTGLYESGASNYAGQSFAPATSQVAVMAKTEAFPSSVVGVEHGWLEARFADISKRIEDSLNELNPDQSFFALGQRVDQLEQHFSTLFEGVATRGDVEGVRLIEAHVSELASHLEHAHSQLQRLDVIESHLAGIAGQLDDVHRAALATTEPGNGEFYPQSSAIDLNTVARTAAEVAAHEFTKFQPRDGASAETSEIGSMLRSFIAESRQGDENTTALLDTLQQAMIRLLDRVDAMELSALQSAQAQSQMHAQPFTHAPSHLRAAPAEEFVHEHQRFDAQPHAEHHSPEPDPILEIDAAVAAVANARAMPRQPEKAAVKEVEEPQQRSPERIRQDFIAEARRAKMRLAEEANGVDNAPAASVDTVKQAPSAARTALKAGSAQSAKKQNAVDNSQRIKVLALSAMLALGGVWLAKESGLFTSDPLIATSPDAGSGGDVAKSADNAGATPSNPADAGSGTLVPSTAGETPVPGTGGAAPSDMKLPEGTRGEILSDDIIVGSADAPMHGVAVDLAQPMTAEGLARARRQQAMANVSGKLGEAAQRNSGTAMPAALDLNAVADDAAAAEERRASVARSGMSQSSALDLPPATVGPLSLRLAAANGDPSAEFEVGARLAEGKGTEQTFKDAAKWYQRSASKGFAQAQYRIGTLYERGLGLKTDVERAKEWYTRAADQGNIKAMHNLAVLSANQSNSTPDYATAAQWFQKAAEYGLADSQFNLAVLNENGLGVPEDLVAAYKWLSLSAKSGDKEAIKRRDILKGKLTAAQLAEGDKQIATWRSKRSDPEINDARKAGEAWKNNPSNGVNG